MRVEALHPEFGAKIDGVDLGRPLLRNEFDSIDDAINRYSVLLFPGQQLDDEAHLAFTRLFGQLEEEHVAYYSRGEVTYIGALGNVDADGNRADAGNRRVRSQTGNEMWHSDSSFREIPSMYSILRAREVPDQGGDTEFVSCRAAYSRLDDHLRETIEPLIGIHDYIYSRTKVSEDAVTPGQREFMHPVRQRLVRRNPHTGDKNYFVGSHVRDIMDWPREEARRLLDALLAEATRPESIYRHRWQSGDVVMWDNRCVLHRGCGYDADRFRRRLLQTRVRCEGPSLGERL